MRNTAGDLRQNYELSREIAKKHNRKLGLCGNPLANMLMAEEKIVQKDCKARKAIGDDSTDCLGIVQANDWHRGVRVWLWGLNTHLILSALSEAGRLVLYLDATKMGNFGLDPTPYKDKVQCVRLAIQPADACLRKEDIEVMPKKFKMKGISLSDAMQTRNRACDISSYLSALFEDCWKSTGIKCSPLLVHTDLAPQLKTGVLEAANDEGQVTTQIQYSNVLLYLFLRLSDKMQLEVASAGDWVEAAKWARSVHGKYSNCALHDCGSHTWRAHSSWPKSKDRDKDDKEVKMHERQFAEIISLLSNRTKNMNDVAVAIVGVCQAMAMVTQDKLPCGSFDLESETQDSYEDSEAIAIATKLGQHMTARAESIRIKTDAEMYGKLDEVMKAKLKDQIFLGGAVGDDIVKEVAADYTFSMTYLKSKNAEKSTGVIEVAYVYYPFTEDGTTIEPQCIDGFSLEVNLPFDGTAGIDNFLKSPGTAKYLRLWMLVKIPLWIQTGVTMIEKEKDMVLAKSNQMLEGTFNNEKNTVTKLKKHLQQPATYFHYRYENLDEASKYLVTEMDATEVSLNKRKVMLKGRNDEAEKQKLELQGATEDSRALQTENASDMVFERKSAKSWKTDEDDLMKEMKEAMLMAPTGVVAKQNNSQWQSALAAHAASMSNGKTFMSKPTFNKWLRGHSSDPLDDNNIAILRDFIAKHGVGDGKENGEEKDD